MLSRSLRGLFKFDVVKLSITNRGLGKICSSESHNKMLRFDGKVAIVTGAGGGLGREYALLFAERGASVVVNDLGSSPSGDGGLSAPADAVVQEIKNKGGNAVANYDSVENGSNIVQTALQNFGRIDILINNAGILRDKTFKNITDDDWDSIFRVHVKGSFNVTRAVWNHMCAQKYGRIIMTSSNSGIYGNFGQASYSAAKAALIGLSKTLSIEGQKQNVFCNVVVPTAASRLTKSLMPDDVANSLRPDYVAPLVAWLCHESCAENGGVFESAAGWFGKIENWRSNGKVLIDSKGKIVPEYVRDNWSKIVDMNDAKCFDSLNSELSNLIENVQFFNNTKHDAKPPAYIDAEKKRSRHTRYEPIKFQYEAKDAILYAISIGATVEKNLNLLYENHENFCVFPLFAVVPNATVVKQLVEFKIPRVKFDFAKLLHGEQYFEFKKPFAPSGHLVSHCKLVDVMDKGNASVALLNVDIKDERDESIAFGQYNIFFRDAGGFGGFRTSEHDIKCEPTPTNRKPDYVFQERTSPNQAALYRQASGDLNPIHIDPNFAKVAGFDSPILHGLCTLGFSTRHIVEKYSPNDYTKLKAVKVRFSKPVFPGQTLITETWKGANNRIHFQTKVKETGKTVISDGYVDFFTSEQIVRPFPPTTTEAPKVPKPDLKCLAVFDLLKKRLSADPTIVKQIQAVYLWVITKNGQEAAKFTVDLKNLNGSIYDGEPDKSSNGKADVTLTLDDQDMVDLVSGSLNPQKAFMTGKLKLKGNIMLTQKLQKLFQDKSKL